MAARRMGLGRGLDSLIPNKTGAQGTSKEGSDKKDARKKAEKGQKASKAKTSRKKAETKETATETQESIEAEVRRQTARRTSKPVKKEESKPAASEEAAAVITAPEPSPAAGELPADSVPEPEAPEREEAGMTAEGAVPAEEETEPAVEIAPEEVPEPVRVPDSAKTGEEVILLKISQVEPNREQPRKVFRDEAIGELADSIRQYGVISPLLVQKKKNYYEIIAGERRWRAAKKAGLREIPVIVKDYSSQTAVEVSLIENIQREDLNPMEEAKAYDRLVREFFMSQEEVAQKVSRNRSTIANSMRLLRLDPEVQNYVADGRLSEGHARAILGIPAQDVQRSVAERVTAEHLSVRETEKIVRELTAPKPVRTSAPDYARERILKDLSERLKRKFGTKVTIRQNSRKRGKIEIEFYSDEELDRIYELLQSADQGGV